MLEKLYVDNYKCLVNFEFRPSSRQLIIGPNGTGKSTALQVLGLLGDFAVRGLDCETRFMGATRTRWQSVKTQRFRIEVKGNGGMYVYELVLDEFGHPSRPRVVEEKLAFDGQPLFQFELGKLSLFGDQKRDKPGATFPFDWHRSGLAIVDARNDNRKLTWFKQWLGRAIPVQINPWNLSSRSEKEVREPAADMSNFADWYRHLKLDSGTQVFQALQDLRESIPGLESLDVKEAGMDVRVVTAGIRGVDGKLIDLPLDDLSEGQRALIVLYILLHCYMTDESTVLIDEPDNFIALAEIQPWLMKMLDRAEERRAQIIFVSHHPEMMNQLAGEAGVVFDRADGGATRVLPFEAGADSGLTPAEVVARGWERA